MAALMKKRVLAEFTQSQVCIVRDIYFLLDICIIIFMFVGYQ